MPSLLDPVLSDIQASDARASAKLRLRRERCAKPNAKLLTCPGIARPIQPRWGVPLDQLFSITGFQVSHALSSCLATPFFTDKSHCNR